MEIDRKKLLAYKEKFEAILATCEPDSPMWHTCETIVDHVDTLLFEERMTGKVEADEWEWLKAVTERMAN